MRSTEAGTLYGGKRPLGSSRRKKRAVFGPDLIIPALRNTANKSPPGIFHLLFEY